MPLRDGSDDETVSYNIVKLLGEGYPEDQAKAIAYRKAGRIKDDPKKKQVGERIGKRVDP